MAHKRNDTEIYVQRKTSPGANFCTIKLVWTGPKLKQSLSLNQATKEVLPYAG
jgi:hypothetical protein